jgi:putative NADH-flavin reductase
MKLIIFGSTGGTGRELVRQALDRGHAVTAFARDPAPLGPRDGLRAVAGDVLDPEAVERAVAGHDAVICALGKPATSPGRLRSEGTRNIVRAMQGSGPRRLLCMSTIGIGETRRLLPPLYKYALVPTLLRRTFAEHARQEEVVRSSELDWTVVRAGVLTDDPATGRFRHGFPATDRSVKVEVSRADVADFMLDQIGETAYVRATPSVSY